MLAVVRDRAIHHPADQFHVALLFRFDRPCHERQRILGATLDCAGLRQASTAALPVYGARGLSIRDATLGPSKDRRVPAHSSRQPGKVPEPGKGTNRTEGRERDRTRVLDHESLAQLVSAQVSDLPLGGSGMTCPRCQQDNPSHANFCLACGIPLRRTSESGPPGVPYAELRRALTEGTEQQRATAEILRVISRSHSDAQPVFDAIVENAARLCDGLFSGAFQFDGEHLHLAAQYNIGPEGLAELHRLYPTPPSRALIVGQAILERAVVHISDIEVDPEGHYPTKSRTLARKIGWRSVLVVPMLREGAPIGVITVGRAMPGRFSDSEIALLQTFADQAVIAIENVRLLKELETRNHDLIEALDRQTATSEILGVISSSPTEIQPVFDAIVRSAVRLCGASHGGVYRLDGELIHSVAHDGYTLEQLEQWRTTWPRPVTSGTSLASEAIRTRSVVRSGDIEAATIIQLSAEVRANLRSRGSRSILAVPMIRQGNVIGAIALAHPGVEAFSDTHVELLETFADQAVIAIENVRLFAELQKSNHELTTALDQQTATSEVLKVISRSTFDLEPVLQTL